VSDDGFESISSVTFDNNRYPRLRYECAFHIDALYLRYRMSISTRKVCDIEVIIRYRRSESKTVTFNIEGPMMNTSRVVNIEVSCFQYRINIVRYRIFTLYTILKVFLTFNIEGRVIIYWVQCHDSIRYSIHPMSLSFTAERKLPLPRLHRACAE
jgi:hypothetical protein